MGDNGIRKEFGPLRFEFWPKVGEVDCGLTDHHERAWNTDIPIDEMIKALREAANWLEWRRACEKRGEG